MKIDITTIPGYKEDMTPEEKLELISNADFNVVKKASFDEAASELAKIKKEAKEKLDEAGKTSGSQAQRIQELESKMKELEREKTVSRYKAKYLGIGYDEESADKAAIALADGDTETLFELQNTATEAAKSAALSDKMRSMGAPVGGAPKSNSYTLEQIKQMTPEEINANWEDISKSLSAN